MNKHLVIVSCFGALQSFIFLSLFLYPEVEGLLSFRAYFPSAAASVSCTTAYQ